ncbi:MAG: hypothetical protein Q4D06_02480 [Coriobacteriia bacterium]|nr:hypothetical protein [Coriobacteriia bacterium]
MARKKSAEELALEAELSAVKNAKRGKKDKNATAEQALEAELASGRGAKRSGNSGKAEGDAALPEVEAPSRTKERKKPQLPKQLAFLSSPKGKLAAAGAVVALIVVVVAVAGVVKWNSTDKWDGSADVEWYDPANPKESYTLTTAEQLAGLGKLVDEEAVLFQGVTVKLGCNLDMYDIPMKPIGSGRTINGVTYEFNGNFDGQGHTISGLNVEEDTWDDCGLFGAVAGDYVKNLTVEGKVTGEVSVGGIAGVANSTSFVNCTNRCKVTALRTATSFYPVSANCGGVVGMWLAARTKDNMGFELKNLVNEGQVSARAASVGGVVGHLASSNGARLAVEGLTNRGTVELFAETDERDEGAGGVIGLVGAYGDSTTFAKLVNDGEVSCSSVLCVGGVFGSFGQPAETCTVSDCVNNGRVAANASDDRAHVGGVFGYVDDPAEEYPGCANNGELAATNGNADDVYSDAGKGVWDQWEIEHPKSY